ncbi:MAG: PepSY domain-containing protein, partial [Odoribacter sp.]|nr:PepSY domain-containing protein [Odoribacter sp.]
STYYINPNNGNLRYFNNNTKARRWTYQGLHSYKFKFLAERPLLWNMVMWITMLVGTIVSFTGVWLGLKYLKRKFLK